jgi:hypothetical protein
MAARIASKDIPVKSNNNKWVGRPDTAARKREMDIGGCVEAVLQVLAGTRLMETG